LRREGPAAWRLQTVLADLERSLGFVEDAARRTGLQDVLAKLRALSPPPA
jgi:hypothetical protein